MRESATKEPEHLIPLEESKGFSPFDTLEEVGQDFDVTRERIRQIEIRALKRLRRPNRAKRLRSFLDIWRYEQSEASGLTPSKNRI